MAATEHDGALPAQARANVSFNQGRPKHRGVFPNNLLQEDPWDLHSIPDGREGPPLLSRREFPINPMEMGSKSHLKSKKATFLAQLS